MTAQLDLQLVTVEVFKAFSPVQNFDGHGNARPSASKLQFPLLSDIPQVACHLTRRSPDQACGSSIFYL
ncbi:hypothetical protein, partial [Tateyamaria pelophila]|uniref:hypothetical protein n=1 Tax=Tateyamaria pelophila TaxID=328415 RepID=UPI001CC1B6E2